MSKKRETVTITTIKNGVEVETKKSKINVTRCDECGTVLPSADEDGNHSHDYSCEICGKDLCDVHRIEVHYLKTEWGNDGKYVCSSCKTEFSEELKDIELAAAAYRQASITHHKCGETWKVLYNTLRDHVEKSPIKWRTGYEPKKKKETEITIIKKDDIEISRSEKSDEFYACEVCGRNVGHFMDLFKQCEICGKVLCEDHMIKTPFLQGTQICAECDRDFREEITNIKVSNQATHEALLSNTKAGKIYHDLICGLMNKGKRLIDAGVKVDYRRYKVG